MATLQSNPVLDDALDSAFEKMSDKISKVKLLTLKEQTCEVFVEHGGLEVTIELDENAEVHFHNLNADRYGKTGKGGAKRDRRYYLISFGLGGSLSVDGRSETVRVRYKPSVGRPSRTKSK